MKSGRAARRAGAPTEKITVAETIQIANCVRPTAPTPRIFPSMSSYGRMDERTTSTMREVFSSNTDLMTATA